MRTKSPNPLDEMVQAKFPDLISHVTPFTEQARAFSRFLPEKALSDAGTNAWAQSGSQTLIAEKKTVVLSPKSTTSLNSREKTELNLLAYLLEQLGFTVLIPYQDQLVTYNAQLFDEKTCLQVGKQTQQAVKKMAADGLTPGKKRIPVDQLYIFDGLENQYNDRWIDQWINELSAILYSPTAVAVGKVVICNDNDIPATADILCFQDKNTPIRPTYFTDHFKTTEKSGDAVLSNIITHLDETQVNATTSRHLLQQTAALLTLTNTPALPLSTLMTLPIALQDEVLEHHNAVIAWITWGLSLEVLINIDSDLRLTILKNHQRLLGALEATNCTCYDILTKPVVDLDTQINNTEKLALIQLITAIRQAAISDQNTQNEATASNNSTSLHAVSIRQPLTTEQARSLRSYHANIQTLSIEGIDAFDTLDTEDYNQEKAVFEKLQHLTILGKINESTDSLFMLLEKAPALKTLTLKSTDITPETIKKINTDFPEISITTTSPQAQISHEHQVKINQIKPSAWLNQVISQIKNISNPSDKTLLSKLIFSLTQSDQQTQTTSLHLLAQYAPQQFIELVLSSRSDSQLFSFLINAILTQENRQNKTPCQLLVTNQSCDFYLTTRMISEIIIKIVAHTLPHRYLNLLCDLLLSKTTDGQHFLAKLTRFNPADLTLFLSTLISHKDKVSSTHFNQIFKTLSKKNMDYYWQQLVMHGPAHISVFLDMLIQHKVQIDTDTLNNILGALNEENDNGLGLWEILAICSPAYLTAFLDTLIKHKNHIEPTILNKILNAIDAKNDDHWNLWHKLAICSPAHLTAFLNTLIKHKNQIDPTILNKILNALSANNDDDWSLWQKLVFYGPAHISVFLDALIKHKNEIGEHHFKHVLDALIIPEKRHFNIWHMLVACQPGYLPAFLEALIKHKEQIETDTFNNILGALNKKDRSGWTPWQQLTQQGPALLSTFLDTVIKHKEQIDTDTFNNMLGALNEKTNDGLTLWYTLAHHGAAHLPDFLHALIKHKNQIGVKNLNQLLIALTSKSRDQRTSLQILFHKNASQLPKLKSLLESNALKGISDEVTATVTLLQKMIAQLIEEAHAGNTTLDENETQQDPHTVYATKSGRVANHIDDDFDTKHNGEITYTHAVSFKHLSRDKPNTIEYTRDQIVILNQDTLGFEIAPGSGDFRDITFENRPNPSPREIRQYNFYQSGEITLEASNNQIINLSGLTAHDQLWQVTLNGSALEKSAFSVQRNRFGQYRLCFKKSVSGQLQFLLNINPSSAQATTSKQYESDKNWWARVSIDKNIIPPALSRLVDEIRAFPSSGSAALDLADQPSEIKRLEKKRATNPTSLSINDKKTLNKACIKAMRAQRLGSCRHRVHLFLYEYQQLINSYKSNDDSPYKTIQVRGVRKGMGVHRDIEITIDRGQTWHTLDLGGYSCIARYDNSSHAKQAPKKPEKKRPTRQKEEAPAGTAAVAASSDDQTPDDSLAISTNHASMSPVQTLSADTIENAYNEWQKTCSAVIKNTGSSACVTFRDQCAIDAFVADVRATASSQQRPIYYIDTPDAFDTSKPRLSLNTATKTCAVQLPPTGLWHDCCTQNSAPPIVIINWSQFGTHQAVTQYNWVFDREENELTAAKGARQKQNLKLTKDAVIISVLDVSHKKTQHLRDDAPFVSRHATGGTHDLSNNPLFFAHADELLGHAALVTSATKDTSAPVSTSDDTGAADSANNTPIHINLHQSADWMRIILGYPYLDGTIVKWQQGSLLTAIEQVSPTQPIVFDNLPFANSAAMTAFISFYEKLTQGGIFLKPASNGVEKENAVIEVFNETITLPGRRVYAKSCDKNMRFATDTSLSITTTDLSIDQLPATRLERDRFLINAATFDICLFDKQLTQAQDNSGRYLMQKLPGLIEAASQDDASTLKLCIHTNLSETQWSLLLETAKAHRVHLDLLITNNVTIPKAIKQIAPVASPEISSVALKKNKLILTNDVHFSLHQLPEINNAAEQTLIVIDITNVNIDELLYTLSEKRVDGVFYFTQTDSAVWQALTSGQTVILKGHCTPEKLNYLSTLFTANPYLYREGRKHPMVGKLIIIADRTISAPEWLSAEHQTVTAEDKQQAFPMTSNDAPQNEAFLANVLKNKTATLEQHIHDIASTSPAKDLVNTQLSALKCQTFEKRIASQLQEIFTQSPYAVLTAESATIRQAMLTSLAENPDSPITFYQEDEIKQWAKGLEAATTNTPALKVLIRYHAEQDARETDLLNPTPSIFIDGKQHLLPSNCKILYIQRPAIKATALKTSNQHSPVRAALPDSCTIDLDEAPKAFLWHRVLSPLHKAFAPISKQPQSHPLTLFAQQIRQQRDIENSKTALIQSSNPSKVITMLHKQLMVTQTRSITNAQAEEHTTIGDYVLTTSRQPIADKLSTLLTVRQNKRNMAAVNTQAALSRNHRSTRLRTYPANFNTANKLIIEGPSGIGKSAFMSAILKAQGYTEAGTETDVTHAHNSKTYYHLRIGASYAHKKAILDSAYKTGAIVLIDEIDTDPVLAKQLHRYLNGEHTAPTANRTPGFTLLGTANGISHHGRDFVFDADDDDVLQMQEYTQAELEEIFSAKKRLTPAIKACIKHFIQNHKADNTTFRTLSHKIEQIYQAERKTPTPQVSAAQTGLFRSPQPANSSTQNAPMMQTISG